MTELDVIARLARVEATQQIQQLPARYAMAIDARDMASVADLFVEDVDTGGRGIGRQALQDYFTKATSQFYRSIHQIVGHTFDFIDETHAAGRVYCRAEHERGTEWIVAALCYFDKYECRAGKWLFAKRELSFFYLADLLEHPQDSGFQHWIGPAPRVAPMMISQFPCWQPFWSELSDEELAALTSQPCLGFASPSA